MVKTPYDETHYESFSYPQTHPQHAYTLGKLFGIDPPDFKKARILEVGCASGGNLIPVAYQLPETKCVGIDLSAEQIKSGNDLIESLKLKNISLNVQSILDVEKSLGKFDYIIAHGVYSWVGTEAQQKIFEIFEKHLSKNGVGYVSYNTMPGWAMVKSLRDMMLFHTRNIVDPKQKAQQSRALLQFLAEGLEDQESAYADFVGQEMALLNKQPDAYLLHDHLEADNTPVYFHQLVAQAGEHHLAYLADTSLPQMFVENMGKYFAKELRQVSDIILVNQYMDYIRNQRFRATLFCHENVAIQRNINSYDIEHFYLSYAASKETFSEEIDLTEGKEVHFKGAHIGLSVSSRISKAAMYALVQATKPISYDQLLQAIETLLGEKVPDLKQHLNNQLNLMRLVMGGLIHIHSMAPDFTSMPSEHPQTTDLVLAQAKRYPFVTNQSHASIRLNPFERRLIQKCDGKHTKESLLKALMGDIKKGEIIFYDENQNKVEDEKQIEKQLSEAYNATLNRFAQLRLLVG